MPGPGPSVSTRLGPEPGLPFHATSDAEPRTCRGQDRTSQAWCLATRRASRSTAHSTFLTWAAESQSASAGGAWAVLPDGPDDH